MRTPDPLRPRSLPGIPAALFRALLPRAERDEVLADLAAEHAARCAQAGRVAAARWLWIELITSLPSLGRRVLWRGWTGFEPPASRMQPGGSIVETWIMDLRYSARRLAGRPTYALLAILTLALGAGGTAAVVSIVRALLLDPLPVTREAELGVLWMPHDWSEREFLTLRPKFPGFQRMAAYYSTDATLEIPGAPLRLVRGLRSSAELFDTLGAGPFIGRTFQAGDDVQGAPAIAILSHRLWQQLGADRTIVGRQLRLGGVPRTIVGVMPPGFWFPSPLIDVWIATPLNIQNNSGNYALIGRIEPGARIDGMQAPLRALADTLGEQFDYPPQWDKTKAPGITPLREYLVGDVRPALLATLAAMALILITACVNVTALMLGQISGRSSELAVRTALGAGRQRLMLQLLAESLLIGAIAGVAGAALGAGGFRLLVASLPLGTLAETATLDWTVLWASVGLALAGAAIIAAIPALVLWRANLQGMLSSTRTSGVSARGGRLEGGLVVLQIALAVLLAAGAGLLMRSVGKLRAIDAGIQVEGVAVVDATLPTQLATAARRRAILDALPVLQAIPGVRAAAASMKLPLRGSGQSWGIRIDGKPELPATTTFVRVASHEYFKALGFQVVRGRGFEPTDRENTERVVVINEALAAKYFPGEDPIGRRVHTGFDQQGERIVGIVRNVSEADLTDAPAPARYMLYDQVPFVWHQVSFVVAASDPSQVPAVLQAARSTLQREARFLAVGDTVTMETVFEEAVGAPRHMATLLSLLAGLAVVLGAVGVYGMISHAVARRTREYGIRIALGLPPTRVLSQVTGRGLALVAAGSIMGVFAAIGLGRLISSLLYGVGVADPAALLGAVGTLTAAGALAAYVPARRASRTDPAVVLREQ